MIGPDSAMVRCDPGLEKENMVPRLRTLESGSGGVGLIRTRGLTTSEHKSHSVLKDSSLNNQIPISSTLCKAKFGCSEKEGVKNFADDCYGGKLSANSLEQLREKLGQLKNVGVQKQSSHKSTSAPEHRSGDELHPRGFTSIAVEPSVRVYKDEDISNSVGIQKEVSQGASHGRMRENKLSSVVMPVLGHAESSIEQNHDACGEQVSPSTPSKSSIPGGRFVHSESGNGGLNPVDKESVTSAVVGNESKCILDQNSQRKTPVSCETVRNTSPREEEAEINHDGSVERRSAFANKIFKRTKGSSYGPALRVRRDDPRAYSKDDHSPGSEKSADNVELRSPKAPHGSTKMEHPSDTQLIARDSLAAGTVSSSRSNVGLNHNTALPTDESNSIDNRKRKADADPSVTDSSLVLTGAVTDKHSSVTNALEDYESVAKGGKAVELERGRGRGVALRETGAEIRSLEQHGDRWSQDVAGHPPVVNCAKGTPVHDREPWARKQARDLRSAILTSPNSSEHVKPAKVNGGLPPRCTPLISGSRDGKTEANGSPILYSSKYQSAVLKQNEVDKSESINGVVPPSANHVKSVASTDDHAVNHLSNSFSTISIEERSASGSIGKTSTQARTPTHFSGHHMNSVIPESSSLTGVSGMTCLTGLTSQSGVSHKTAVTSSHGVEPQNRPHIQPHAREWDRGTEISDHKELSKGTSRSTVTSSEVPASDVHEAQPSKACDTPKENVEINHDNQPLHQQPQRKVRMETENENFVYVNGTRYQKLGKIGKGGSSEVFKVIATNCSIYALKRINLKGRDWSTAQEFYQEIKYLKALRGKRHIIQLIDSEVTNKKVLEKRWEGREITEEAFIYMVLEYGEIDLAGMLASKRKEMKMMNESKLDENWLRFYWQQMLEAVRTIHDERIVHSDLKPANFMLVRGELKLIDFGIAKAIQNDTTNIVRDSQAGTLNYMSPEACLQNQTDEEGLEIKQGRASDIWSLGCILYQMVYGHTPFAELSFYSKIQAITNPHHKINYPAVTNPWLLDIMKKCLTWDRRKRLRIPELLEHPFLQPHLSPFCARCEQLSSRMSSSEKKQLVDQILSSYENWGQRYGSRSSASCGQGSPI